MDPDSALAILRELVKEYDRPDEDLPPDFIRELVETFDGLDTWLSMGGMYPQAWSPTAGIVP